MRFLLAFLLLFTVFHPAGAQTSLFDALHERGDSVVVRIDTDWDQLMKKKTEKKYRPVTVRITGLDTLLTISGKIRTRGNVRLNVCSNPSLKIKLAKDELEVAGFSRLNDLKFVLQCSNNAIGENYLVLEKLTYDLHAIYSRHHHRVLPVTVLPEQKDGLEIRAFMLEDEEQLSERYQGTILESKRASTRGIQRRAYLNMCLFNYMILNTDWHVFNLHNVEFVKPDEGKELIPLPYDFDYSGFVNTSYAIPRPELGITSVHIPLFLGKHVTRAEIMTAAKQFLALRPVALAFLDNHPDILERDRKRLRKRLEKFYEVIGSEKKLMRLIR